MEGISRPHIVTQSGTTKNAKPLVRLPLDRGDYDEDWIQDLLDQAPDILPVEEIDDRVMLPLFSMGREIPIHTGSIDNLFISQNSHVVLVETKLWRNPEARRNAVAQTLDYASYIRHWRYSDLDQLWRRKHPNTSLWESLNPEGFTETEWIDRVNYLLSQGQLTLLIVGDGIRSETEVLAKAVGAQPDFHYRLGLVELRLFALESGDVLVLPMTIAKTVEIERAVVRITYSQEPQPQAKVELPEPKLPKRSVLSREAFLTDLASIPGTGQQCVQVASRILDLLEKSELTIEWQGSGFSVKMPDPAGSGVMLSLAGVQSTGKCGAYFPWLRGQLTRIWNNEKATEQIVKAQRQLFLQLGGKMTSAGLQVTVNLPQLAGREEEFVQGLIQLSEEISAVAHDIQASL